MKSNVIPEIIFSITALCLTQNCGISASAVAPIINGNDIRDIADITILDCTLNETCTTPRSFCRAGWCRCPRDYTFNAPLTACIEVAFGYGAECTETAQCVAYLSAGGICTDGVCSCATGYHYLSGHCRKSSGLGDKCRHNRDCNVNGDFEALACMDGVCFCRVGFYQREYRTCRRLAQQIGADCTIDLDCKFHPEARCNKRTGCYLNWEGTMNVNKDKIASIVSLDLQDHRHISAKTEMECTTDQDCYDYGEASCSPLGFCVCQPGNGFHPTLETCVPELGTWCEPGHPVKISHSICRNNLWSCTGPRVPSRNNLACLKATTKFNTSCQFDEQCYVFGPDSLCVDKRCICNENSHYVEEDMFCWMNREINESCQKDKDCYMNNFDSKLHCNEMSRCACPTGSHVNAARTFCVPNTPVLGDRCSTDVDCVSLNNAQCFNGFCKCVDRYFELAGVCVAGINASCHDSFDCKTQNSTCDGTICRCMDGLVSPSPDLCIPVSPFGSECQYDIQCSSSTPDAICSRQELAAPNESTTAESILTSNGTCKCSEGHHRNLGKCYKKKVLGRWCSSQGECYVTSDPDSVRCLKGICICNSNARYINSTFCQTDGSMTVVFSSWLILSLISVIYIL